MTFMTLGQPPQLAREIGQVSREWLGSEPVLFLICTGHAMPWERPVRLAARARFNLAHR
jgi:hypothetical protein